MNLPTFDIPPVGPKQGKIWGTTQLLFARNDVEGHIIRFQAGRYCSKHYHVHKFNRFVVVTGKLLVRSFMDEGTVDEILLASGQMTDVAPNTLHQFEGVETGIALEFYWVCLCPLDIERNVPGGIIEVPESIEKEVLGDS